MIKVSDKIKKRLISGAVIISIIIALSFVVGIFTGTNCLIKSVTGLPCPGCGMTRAYLSLLHFDFHSAFYYHPLYFLVPIIFTLASMSIFKPAIMDKKWFTALMIIFTLAFIACYIARMIIDFPHTAPMDFGEKSLIGRIIKKISGN